MSRAILAISHDACKAFCRKRFHHRANRKSASSRAPVRACAAANLLFYDYHVEWLPLVPGPIYPEHLAFEPALGFIPNPYVEGDNCIYEVEPDLRGETYIHYYNCLRWDKCFIDMVGHRQIPRQGKDPTPPGWFPCP